MTPMVARATPRKGGRIHRVALAGTMVAIALTGHAAPPSEVLVQTPVGTQHTLVLVPAGTFTMGGGRGGDNPAHLVRLSASYIDRLETTNLASTSFNAGS